MAEQRTVGIVGTGHVGMAAAYAIFQQGAARRIILTDRDRSRAQGEAMDLMHGQAYVGHCDVIAGDYADLAQAQVIIVAAGVAQRPGESRLALLGRNATVFAEIARALDRHAPGAVLLVASNPVDLLTYILQTLSRRPHRRVIGTGTMLDTTRFRSLLSDHYGCDPRSVHAFILGEHGDTEVPVWSSAQIAGTRLQGNTVLGRPWDWPAMQDLFEQVRGAAGSVIDRKGYTNWAIGLVLAHLVRTIQADQRSLLPVSVRLEGEYGLGQVCLSVPTAVGREGVGQRLPPHLAADERAALRASGQGLRASLAELDYG